MAGKFRGAVGKLSKEKKSKTAKRAKGKRVNSMVKRSRKLPEAQLQNRIAELTGSFGASSSTAAPIAISAGTAPVAQSVKPVGKATIEIVGEHKEKFTPEENLGPQRTSAEAQGLRILNQAMKNQSYNRLLTHQNRHDYEYRLRSIATLGVVQLFNSLAQARKASSAVEAELTENEKQLTSDKLTDKKQLVSKEAFLAALRQPKQAQEY